MTVEKVLTDKQWKMVEEEAEKVIKQFTELFSIEHLAAEEIHEHEGVWEQRTGIGLWTVFTSYLDDIFEELYGIDSRDVTGFYDFLNDMEVKLSYQFGDGLDIYADCDTVFVYRTWDSIEDIPAELRELVQEF